jgi:hypothetical protein
MNCRIISFFVSIVKAGRSRHSDYAAVAFVGSLRAWALLALASVVICTASFAQNPATSVAVDANANQHPINPNVYGVCFGTQSDIAALNAPLNRFGGNNTSDYNWQQDALNLDFDWYFESYLMDGTPVVPGAYYDNAIQDTYNANVGSEPMITIPMLPYIAKVASDATSGAASLWSYSIAKYGAQVACGSLAANDPYQSDAGSGCLSGGGYLKNDPTDAYVTNTVAIEQALVQHLVGKWGLSTTSTGIKYYILDNEPSLWSSTHRDVYPNPETYSEEYDNIVAYATAIRAVDPNAKIVAPEEWSWWAMYLSGLDQAKGTGSGSDYETHGNAYYYPWLLQQLYAYQQSTGTKLVDVLSVHCYSDASSNLNVATRELWDPNYHDPDWYADSGLNGGVLEWIPLMRQWVNQYYPGLEIGCTEYNWGNETALVGATTQADVEGIYGLYGFDLATRWTVPAQPTYLAMQIYRNYDGKLSTFGDTSVSATVADPDNLSAFAALRTTDNALTVMVINKQTGATPVTVSLANFSTTGTAQAYQVSSATQTSINSLGSVAVANNSISATVPSQSITLFVIPSGSVLSVPSTPTGLTATVGNGTVTLTWNAGGGATSYTVSRGSASAGPFTTIGTVTSPAPTTLTDTNVTNGNTYYYVVSGTNSKGTSPNSSPVAATPLVPPTFTSSATASPNPVTQNVSTTITATVKCTANSLSNGTVQIIALDPNGNVALTQNFTAQSFTSNQTQTYTASLTPTLAGTYTVEVGVLSATGQQWSLNTSAGTITVNSALSFTSSATPSPTSIPINGSSTVTVTVKDTGTVGLTSGIVQLLILDPSGNQIVEQNWTGQTFTAGGTLSLTYTFTPSSLSPPETTNGTYTMEIGVFNSTWTTDYYWNSTAGTITLTAAVTPSFAITGAAVSLTAGATTGNTSNVTVTPADGFTGSVALTAAVTSSPAGTVSPPTLSFGSTTPVSITGTTAGTATLTVTTTATTTPGSYTVKVTGTSGATTETGSLTLTVSSAAVPTFSIAGTAVSVAPGATTGNTSTITVTPAGGFTGSVALTAAVTSSPTGAQDLPTLSFGSTSPIVISGANAETATLTISTTAATSGALVYPKRQGVLWYAAGGATLACLLLFGIPARRRRWQTMLGILVLLVALAGGAVACGGSSGGGGSGNSGTTAGSYTITVTGTLGSTSATGTVTLTVQ